MKMSGDMQILNPDFTYHLRADLLTLRISIAYNNFDESID